MKQSILLKNKDRLHKLKKSELIEILLIEINLRVSKNTQMLKQYKPINSKINNTKRAIKKFWNSRKSEYHREKIKKHISILRELYSQKQILA